MVSTGLNSIYSLALRSLLKTRLEGLAAREPQIDQGETPPSLLLIKLLGLEDGFNQRQWIARASHLLNTAKLDSGSTPPQFIDDALRIWPSGTLFSEKVALMGAVQTYLEDSLLAALDRMPIPRQPSIAHQPRELAPVTVSSNVVATDFPLLPEGGLPILRRLMDEAPQDGPLETYLTYIRRFLNRQPFPMVAARMQMDRNLGQVLMINRSFSQIFEWEENNLKKELIRDLFLKEKALSVIMKILGLIGTGGEYTPDEIYFKRGDGQFWHCTGAGIITGLVIKKWPGGPYGFGIFSNFKELVSPR